MKKDSRGYFREKGIYKDTPYDFRAKTKEKLRSKVQQFMDKVDSGVVDNDTTVRQWCDIWLETYKKPSVGPARFHQCELYANHLCEEMGGRKVSEIKPVHLQNILNRYDNHSRGYVGLLRSFLYQLFDKAKKNHIISQNPAESLEMPRLYQGTHRAITDSERVLLLSACQTHRVRNWVLLMLYCGLRPSEAAAIQENDIDFESNVVHVTKAFESLTGAIKKPKTASGSRDVPIPDELRTQLKLSGNPFAYIVTTETGEPLNTPSRRESAWVSFVRYINRNFGGEYYGRTLIKGIVADDLVPYCLRHTYCTDLQAAGVPINVAKELMGHSNISVTAQIYTHRSDKATADALEKINALHSGTKRGTIQKKA